MTGQFRDEIGVFQDSCKGMRVWIIGAGPTLDDVPIKTFEGEYVFALNAAATLFKNFRKFPDAWWLWWDQRTYREVWPKLNDWQRVQTIVHKKGMEMLRAHRGSGRFLSYGTGDQFKPKRTVAETALLIADFLGFDEAVLVGVDGLSAKENNEPYCKAINPWKDCHFMKRDKPRSWKNSAQQFDTAMENVLPRIVRMRVIQTSSLYPNRERFVCASIDEVLARKMPKNAKHDRTRKGL